MCTAAHSPAGSGVVRASAGSNALDETLIELICDDRDLLDAEFDAIIAVEWPTPPVECGRIAAACRRLGRGPAGVYGARRGPASRPRHPGIGGWARQRSPPQFGQPTSVRTTHLDLEEGDRHHEKTYLT
jgi:hypothetical protein